MGKTKELFIDCELCDLHCSITWQIITGYSVEIYRGYVVDYEQLFISDGHLTHKKAVKAGLKYLKNRK